MRNCGLRDSAQVVKFFAMLDDEIAKDDQHGFDEFNGAQKMDELRTYADNFLFPSFVTISCVGANAADLSYEPSIESAKKLDKDQLFLLDSGGHYLDGSTDTGRTVHFSAGKDPSPNVKEMYTRVLLGNLELERHVWPKNAGYSGSDLDLLARKYLHEVGLDYPHGTGHGIGTTTGVHEGPYGIFKGANMKLEPGMVCSNEPGFYKEGEYGIRIENNIMVVQHPKYPQNLTFENLTF